MRERAPVSVAEREDQHGEEREGQHFATVDAVCSVTPSARIDSSPP